MALHRSTVEQWYERYVVPDQAPARDKPNNVFQRTFEDSRYPQHEVQPQFSPDGRWLAYCSDESGSGERQIYVRPFPNVDSGGSWQISTGEGNSPRWSPDGKKLYYLIGANIAEAVMAVDVETEPTFSHGKPKVILRGRYLGSLPNNGIPFDVHPDGQRFLMIKQGR